MVTSLRLVRLSATGNRRIVAASRVPCCHYLLKSLGGTLGIGILGYPGITRKYKKI